MTDPIEWFVVVHEFPMENSRGDKRTDYGIASSVHDSYQHADNQLAYCDALQRSGRPGSEGRYFVARLTEVSARDAWLGSGSDVDYEPIPGSAEVQS